jgi:hypothetical protein
MTLIKTLYEASSKLHKTLYEASSKLQSAADRGFALATFQVSKGEDIVVIYEPAAVEFFAEKKEDDQTLAQAFKSLKLSDPKKFGVVAMIQYSKTPALKLMTKKSKKSAVKYVNRSAALGGTGPLVYDAAIWYSDGLASDRSSVSPRAQNVWLKYKERNDVEIIELNESSPSDPAGVMDFAVKMTARPPGLDKLEDAHFDFSNHLDVHYQIDEYELNDALYSMASLLFTKLLGSI